MWLAAIAGLVVLTAPYQLHCRATPAPIGQNHLVLVLPDSRSSPAVVSAFAAGLSETFTVGVMEAGASQDQVRSLVRELFPDGNYVGPSSAHPQPRICGVARFDGAAVIGIGDAAPVAVLVETWVHGHVLLEPVPHRVMDRPAPVQLENALVLNAEGVCGEESRSASKLFLSRQSRATGFFRGTLPISHCEALLAEPSCRECPATENPEGRAGLLAVVTGYLTARLDASGAWHPTRSIELESSRVLGVPEKVSVSVKDDSRKPPR